MADLAVHICPTKDAACVELDDDEKCHSCPSLQLVQQSQSAPEWLLPEDMQALERFNETCEDTQAYDVPKTRMRRLAELGVIQWTGGARYSITAFGQHVLDLLPEGWPRLPLKTQADHDAYVKAEIDKASGYVGDAAPGVPAACPAGHCRTPSVPCRGRCIQLIQPRDTTDKPVPCDGAPSVKVLDAELNRPLHSGGHRA